MISLQGLYRMTMDHKKMVLQKAIDKIEAFAQSLPDSSDYHKKLIDGLNLAMHIVKHCEESITAVVTPSVPEYKLIPLADGEEPQAGDIVVGNGKQFELESRDALGGDLSIDIYSGNTPICAYLDVEDCAALGFTFHRRIVSESPKVPMEWSDIAYVQKNIYKEISMVSISFPYDQFVDKHVDVIIRERLQ